MDDLSTLRSKYVCRKTLADTRPRIRGRFARNDEIGDAGKAAILPNDKEDGVWVKSNHFSTMSNFITPNTNNTTNKF